MNRKGKKSWHRGHFLFEMEDFVDSLVPPSLISYEWTWWGYSFRFPCKSPAHFVMVTIPLPHTFLMGKCARLNSSHWINFVWPLSKGHVRSIICNDYIHVGRIYRMPVLLIFFSSLGVLKNSSCNFFRDFSCVPPFFKFVLFPLLSFHQSQDPQISLHHLAVWCKFLAALHCFHVFWSCFLYFLEAPSYSDTCSICFPTRGSLYKWIFLQSSFSFSTPWPKNFLMPSCLFLGTVPPREVKRTIQSQA